MAIDFTCSCCGRQISGFPDLAFDSPWHYDSIPEAERGERARLDSDFCVIDDKDYFIRAVCYIPVVGSDEPFGWGVWVSLSAENFERYRDTFEDDDQSKLGGMFGWLCNKIPHYPDTLNLKTSVMAQDGNQRPSVWINSSESEHPLFIEQRDGMTKVRLGEIYAAEVCDGND